MKKNIGATLALYPCPVIVVGAMVNDKPTWTLVAHAGTVAHSHLMVSLVQAHYINSECRTVRRARVGAKDTWGENYVQIEGEQGYIYIKGGSNGLASIRVVTKDADEILDEQTHPSRWYYEIQTDSQKPVDNLSAMCYISIADRLSIRFWDFTSV